MLSDTKTRSSERKNADTEGRDLLGRPRHPAWTVPRSMLREFRLPLLIIAFGILIVLLVMFAVDAIPF